MRGLKHTVNRVLNTLDSENQRIFRILPEIVIVHAKLFVKIRIELFKYCTCYKEKVAAINFPVMKTNSNRQERQYTVQAVRNKTSLH